MKSKTLDLLNHLGQYVSPRHRKQFWGLFFLTMLTAIAEMVSIGAVLPFLGILIAPEKIFLSSRFAYLNQFVGFVEPAQLLLPITVIFGSLSVFAGIMRLLLLWANNSFAYSIGADISFEIYRRTLYQPYFTHCSRNSSEVINSITSKTNAVVYIANAVLTLFSSLVILIAILIALLLMDPLIALMSISTFGFIYISIIFFTRKRLQENSVLIASESTKVIKLLQEGLGGIRDVLMDGSQELYCNLYRTADLIHKRAQANNSFIGGSPRYGMEALGMLVVSVLAFILARKESGLVDIIPVLGTLALGAQRLLPALQQAYSAWSGILGGLCSLQDILELLDQPLPDHADLPSQSRMPFKKYISLKEIGFRYSEDGAYILRDVNFNIPKGSRIGFIGQTGGGKSTLLDLIMGLLEPTIGSIEVDGRTLEFSNNRAWQSNIAHVPQSIFLTDGTIEENIAFGIPKHRINQQRVRAAAKQAQIDDLVEGFTQKYQTLVGERGVRLSGGQRQRIGIARALYKEADVIILDEATSALDGETEHAIMRSIESLDRGLTLLIIAHRVTTLKGCDLIVEIGDSGIKRYGAYQEIFQGS